MTERRRASEALAGELRALSGLTGWQRDIVRFCASTSEQAGTEKGRDSVELSLELLSRSLEKLTRTTLSDEQRERVGRCLAVAERLSLAAIDEFDGNGGVA